MKKISISLIFLTLTSILFVSCVKDPVGGGGTDPLPYQEIKDFSYGPSAQQKFDAYLPAGRTAAATKVLITIHGGGWKEGDKADFNEFIKQIQLRDPALAIVNINYRLAGDYTRHPAQVEDIRTVLNKLDSLSPVWQISKKYAMGGASAGGHLSTLYAYGLDPEKRVQAVITIVGPTNLQDQFYKDNLALHLLVANYTGNLHDLNPLTWYNASPVNHVKPGSAPTLMFYGDQDPLVPNSNHILLKQKLVQHGVVHSYNVYAGEGHGFVNPLNQNDVLTKTVNWIKTYVQ